MPTVDQLLDVPQTLAGFAQGHRVHLSLIDCSATIHQHHKHSSVHLVVDTRVCRGHLQLQCAYRSIHELEPISEPRSLGVVVYRAIHCRICVMRQTNIRLLTSLIWSVHEGTLTDLCESAQITGHIISLCIFWKRCSWSAEDRTELKTNVFFKPLAPLHGSNGEPLSSSRLSEMWAR